MFVASVEDDETTYGRVVTLLRVTEDEYTTLDEPQVVDLAVLRVYKVKDLQDQCLRSVISCTQNTSLTLVTNIKFQFNVVPLDLDYFVKQCVSTQKWQRAHWNSWETKEYKGKLLYVPRF